jgi:hypothetical protein
VAVRWGYLPLASARLTPPVQFPEIPFFSRISALVRAVFQLPDQTRICGLALKFIAVP